MALEQNDGSDTLSRWSRKALDPESCLTSQYGDRTYRCSILYYVVLRFDFLSLTGVQVLEKADLQCVSKLNKKNLRLAVCHGARRGADIDLCDLKDKR